MVETNSRIYALSQRQDETYDAAGKAMRDVFAILRDMGAHVIWSVPKNRSRFLKIFDLPYLAIFLLFHVGKHDFVFYSVPENAVKVCLLHAVRRLKKFQTICFVNDLNGIRYDETETLASVPDEAGSQRHDDGSASQWMTGVSGERANSPRTVAPGLELLAAADIVLAPNRSAVAMLRRGGISGRIVPVGVWDYLMTEGQERALSEQARHIKHDMQTGEVSLSDNQDVKKPYGANMCEGMGENAHVDSQTDARYHVAFAGNLNKSEFLLKMKVPDGIILDLWGNLDDEKKAALPEGCNYHGVLSSEEIPLAVASCDCGLVWDGDGEDAISGGLGEYLRYNNSHKCALYIASGIPAIVWEGSGMADFVREHECGVWISRLGEMGDKLEKANWARMRENARCVAGQLRWGYYLRKALETARIATTGEA